MESKKTVVIIGSGIGGLICGAILSKEGYDVTILESNRQIGGTLQIFSREKHVFDSAVHYVGGLSPGQNLYKIFQFLGIMEDLKLEKLDENAFDKIILKSNPGKAYRLAQGYDRFIRNLVDDFPDDEDDIRNYCKHINKVCAGFPLYNMRSGDEYEKTVFLSIDAKHQIESLVKNPELRSVLAGNNLLYAGIGDKTPFYVHALIQNSYIEGSYRFLNGGSQLAHALAARIRKYGGNILTRKEVVRLHEEDRGIQFAETSDGHKYCASWFISNAHPVNTLRMIDSELIRPAYKNRINTLENTTSSFLVNMTLKPGKIKYETSNYYIIMHEDVWDLAQHTESNWPLMCALFFSPQPSGNEYASGITLITYMNFDEVEQWKDSFNTVTRPGMRGDEYSSFKEKKAWQLIEAVEPYMPGLHDAIKNIYISTPLTLRDYLGTDDGSLYGVMKDYRDPVKTKISHRTKIPNLLLTGQNLNLHGVLGASISSLITCSSLIPLNELLDKIENAQFA